MGNPMFFYKKVMQRFIKNIMIDIETKKIMIQIINQ